MRTSAIGTSAMRTSAIGMSAMGTSVVGTSVIRTSATKKIDRPVARGLSIQLYTGNAKVEGLCANNSKLKTALT
eukprot:4257133-Pleurochrysis_carterae.AAC.1